MNMGQWEIIQTQRLVLRKLTMEDLYDGYERIGSDGEVSRYLRWEPHQDIGETLAVLEQILEGYDRGDCLCWGVELEEDGLIGVVTLEPLAGETQNWEFQVMLGKPWWNQGYGTEAADAILRFAREHLDGQGIVGLRLAENEAAGKMMEKLGMVSQGWEKGAVEKHGHSVDVERYAYPQEEHQSITANDYQRLAMELRSAEFEKADGLLNGVMGLCGEAGEVIDLVKKHLHQGHDLDKEALVKELGDVAWYLAETAWALDVTLDQVFRGNLEKLHQRYPQGFSTERSKHRE